jgi:hypothetical protein
MTIPWADIMDSWAIGKTYLLSCLDVYVCLSLTFVNEVFNSRWVLFLFFILKSKGFKKALVESCQALVGCWENHALLWICFVLNWKHKVCWQSIPIFFNFCDLLKYMNFFKLRSSNLQNWGCSEYEFADRFETPRIVNMYLGAFVLTFHVFLFSFQDPFASIWTTDIGTNLSLGFIIFAGLSAGIYFMYLCVLIYKVFRTISAKQAAISAMSRVRRIHYEG